MTLFTRNMLKRLSILFIAVVFSANSILMPTPGYSDEISGILQRLPPIGEIVYPSKAFVPVLLRGMTIDPKNPFRFDFILDRGNTSSTTPQLEAESVRLVKYFLASMTIPQDDLWVNLSPYERERIIPDDLAKTYLGRDLLAQDYLLKQLTASLIYPEAELGTEFWDKIYKLAYERYGTAQIPVNTFNKVWILPETAVVYEHGQTVYIVESRLKVMLDEDYLTLQESRKENLFGLKKMHMKQIEETASLSAKIVKEIILPELEREVNEGAHFSTLRQIYHSLILAKWYKETLKNSVLSELYVDRKATSGIEVDDVAINQQIYDQYLKAYKQGVFNYIREDYDVLSQKPIPRKYFAGGFKDWNIPLIRTQDLKRVVSSAVGNNFILGIKIDPQQASVPFTAEFQLVGSIEKQSLTVHNSIVSSSIMDFVFVDQIIEWIKMNPALAFWAGAGILTAVGLTSAAILDFWQKKTKSGNVYRLRRPNTSKRLEAIDFLGESGVLQKDKSFSDLLVEEDFSIRRYARKYLTYDQQIEGNIKALNYWMGRGYAAGEKVVVEAIEQLRQLALKGDTRVVQALLNGLQSSERLRGRWSFLPKFGTKKVPADTQYDLAEYIVDLYLLNALSRIALPGDQDVYRAVEQLVIEKGYGLEQMQEYLNQDQQVDLNIVALEARMQDKRTDLEFGKQKKSVAQIIEETISELKFLSSDREDSRVTQGLVNILETSESGKLDDSMNLLLIETLAEIAQPLDQNVLRVIALFKNRAIQAKAELALDILNADTPEQRQTLYWNIIENPAKYWYTIRQKAIQELGRLTPKNDPESIKRLTEMILNNRNVRDAVTTLMQIAPEHSFTIDIVNLLEKATEKLAAIKERTKQNEVKTNFIIEEEKYTLLSDILKFHFDGLEFHIQYTPKLTALPERHTKIIPEDKINYEMQTSINPPVVEMVEETIPEHDIDVVTDEGGWPISEERLTVLSALDWSRTQETKLKSEGPVKKDAQGESPWEYYYKLYVDDNEPIRFWRHKYTGEEWLVHGQEKPPGVSSPLSNWEDRSKEGGKEESPWVFDRIENVGGNEAMRVWKHKDTGKEWHEYSDGKPPGINSSPLQALSEKVGGIDLNDIQVEQQGNLIEMPVDSRFLESLKGLKINGFAPVILNFTPIPSLLPILGLDEKIYQESLALQ